MRRTVTALLLLAGVLILLASIAPAYGEPRSASYTASAAYSVAASGSTEVTLTPPPAWLARYRGHRVHKVRTTKKVVALTFDDGPNSRTRLAVDVLDDYGAKGTFFVTGSMSKRVSGAKANRYVLKHGHELANHTMRHNRLNKTYAEDVKAIRDLDKLLLAQTGETVRWVRAMGGAVDKTGLRATRSTGHLYAQWSVSIADSVLGFTPPDRLYHNVVDHVQPGSIVLMHVTHPETLAALPRILRTLKARGYRIVTLSQMAPLGKPYP